LAMNCLSQRQGSRETATERSTETGRQRQRRALLEIGVRLDFHHFQADGVSATCDAPGLCVKAPRTSEGRSAFEDENRVSANYSKSSLTPIAHRVYAARVCPLPSRFGRPFIPGSIGCARLGHSSTAVSAAFLACHFSRNSLKNLFFDAEAERAESQRRNTTTSPREKSSSPLRSCGSRRQKNLMTCSDHCSRAAFSRRLELLQDITKLPHFLAIRSPIVRALSGTCFLVMVERLRSQ